jgi:hypothetical protein
VVLMRDHQRLTIPETFCGPAQVGKDRLAQQRNVAGAVNVAGLVQPSHLRLDLRLIVRLRERTLDLALIQALVLGKQTT